MRFRQRLLEDDAPVGAGEPAGETEKCFDPNTGEEIPCPEQMGDTNPGAEDLTGGAPQNQDTNPSPTEAVKAYVKTVKEQAKKMKVKVETLLPKRLHKFIEDDDATAEPDAQGACPEGYEKDEDGKCKKKSEEPSDADKKAEARRQQLAALGLIEDDDEKKDDDDEDGEDKKDDDEKGDDKDESRTRLYRSRVGEMVASVMGGKNAREVVSQEFIGSKR